jgi:hypothetical protein
LERYTQEIAEVKILLQMMLENFLPFGQFKMLPDWKYFWGYTNPENQRPF